MRDSADIFFAIMRAQLDYARCIDDDRLEEWPDFFADDCLYRVTSASNLRDGMEAAIVFANSKGMLRDRVSALREANIYERHAYRHILSAPCILSQKDDRIQSETSFLVARIMRDGTTEVFATGRYLDAYGFDHGGLKLFERVVVCDSNRIDTLLALPL
jgi:anthranilate 1,2-dioxygenase small subunit